MSKVFGLLVLILPFLELQASSTKVEMTWYWTVKEKNLEKNHGPELPIMTLGGFEIGRAPEKILRRIWMEGSGFIPDGRMINLTCHCPFEKATFMEVDPIKFPYGLDSQGGALVPMKTIAVDPKVIPLGTKVYIPRFADFKLADGRRHDGCFVAADTGHGIKGRRVDVFAGSKALYQQYESKLKTWQQEIIVILNHSEC